MPVKNYQENQKRDFKRTQYLTVYALQYIKFYAGPKTNDIIIQILQLNSFVYNHGRKLHLPIFKN